MLVIEYVPINKIICGINKKQQNRNFSDIEREQLHISI